MPSIHYHLDRNESAQHVRILEVDRDFYMKFHPWKRPEGKEIGVQQVNLRYIDRAEFERRLKGPKFDAEDAHLHDVNMPESSNAREEALPQTPSVSENQRSVPVSNGILAKIKRMFA